LLIGIGIMAGINRRFRGVGWLVPILVGLVFFARKYYHDSFQDNFILPISLLIIGVYFIFRPRYRKDYWSLQQDSQPDQENIDGPLPAIATEASIPEDYIDASVVFGNVRKMAISKNFRGGEVSAIFGSAEVNL